MFKEDTLKGSNHGKVFSIDSNWINTGKPKPVIIFVHGFKGFKDWGTFPLIAQEFASRGYVFIKMNLSHNGVTPEHPYDFVDLHSFSRNTFSIELQDITDVVNLIRSGASGVPRDELDPESISLIGHSRGGSLSYIYASMDPSIRSVSGWGAVCDLENRWPDSMLMEWKEKGVYHMPNSRTGQLMPLTYAIVEDYIAHKDKYHVPTALSSLSTPVLHVHGSQDETVYIQEAKMILKNMSKVDFQVIQDANHTFGGSHPFESQQLPDHSIELINRTDRFLKSVLE